MYLAELYTGPLSVNTYLVSADGSDTCAVIDPGEGEPVLERLERDKKTCTHILITHGHFDHIGGAAALKAQTGAKLYIHILDAPALSSNRASLSMMMGIQIDKAEPDVLLHGGETLEAGGLSFRVLHTPGHSPGGVSYVLDGEKILFSGDTLFCGSYGRTDFPGCSREALQTSVLRTLFGLRGDYRVLPGHGPETTLDEERQYNPLVLGE